MRGRLPDIEERSLDYARRNVATNGLTNTINVVRVSGATVLQELPLQQDLVYDTVMCNPPFYSSREEIAHRQGHKAEAPTTVRRTSPDEHANSVLHPHRTLAFGQFARTVG